MNSPSGNESSPAATPRTRAVPALRAGERRRVSTGRDSKLLFGDHGHGPTLDAEVCIGFVTERVDRARRVRGFDQPLVSDNLIL
jgi:hypothetical protein